MRAKSNPEVSIIVPCYNGEKYLIKTIDSILKQSFVDLELIIVNDGSTDQTDAIIQQIKDDRVIYIKKDNTGVSDSRNEGLKISKGNFLVFFDADDLMGELFIEKRVRFLKQNPGFGFCCSYVLKIDERDEVSPNQLRGASLNLLYEVLTYKSEIVTCPSNYLIRKEVLTNNNLRFNIGLSSSADRYFLVQMSQFTRCGLLNDDAAFLYYRVDKKSMSNLLSADLVNDNLKFKEKVSTLTFIPDETKNLFLFKINFILAGGFFKLKHFSRCLPYAFTSFFYNPKLFIHFLLKL